MRISDWSSDVCSSDLGHQAFRQAARQRRLHEPARIAADHVLIGCPARAEVALRADAVGGGAGQAAFRLGNVGARQLADVEAVLSRLELAAEPLLDRKSTRLNSSH